MSANNIEKYIFYTPNDRTNCCGFFCGNYFITTAHQFIDGEVLTLFVGTVSYKLSKENAVFIECEHKDDSLDLAIFKFENINSPLTINDYYKPSKGDVLESISHVRIADRVTELLKCDVTVTAINEGNYFGVESSKLLKPGSSGSPIFLDNKVVGIVAGGNVDDDGTQYTKEHPLNFCAILKSEAIIKVLTRL